MEKLLDLLERGLFSAAAFIGRLRPERKPELDNTPAWVRQQQELMARFQNGQN